MVILALLACALGEPAGAPGVATAGASGAPLAGAPLAADPGSGRQGPQANGQIAGICDASAAVALDDGRLLIADDEGRSLYIGKPGGPAEVAWTMGEGPELDLEGAARVGQRAAWIGSHGGDADGRPAPSRQVFFTTDLPASNGVITASQPMDLLPMLRAHAALAGPLGAAEGKAPKEGGLSIEGLASHPDGWLVGFRSPLSGSRALIVQIRADASAVDAVHTVDLGGLGVRSIERTEAGDWLVVAGDPGEGDRFALYRWSPEAGARRLDVNLAPLRPEGLVHTAEGWLLLSDDGKVKRPDSTADDGDRTCGKIRRADPAHPSVHARTRVVPVGE